MLNRLRSPEAPAGIAPATVLALLGAVFFSSSAMGAQPAPAQDPPGAVPYDVAFTVREFPRYDAMTVSSDGARVAYVVVTPPQDRPQNERFLPNGTPVSAVGAEIYIADVDARARTESRPICASDGNQWAPSWSPDGRVLAFYSDAEGPPQPWTYTLASRECRRISATVVRASVFGGYRAQWSPDGRTLYVPLHPEPPSSAAAAGAAPTGPMTGSASGSTGPLVFLSGSERPAERKDGNAKSGDSAEWFMNQYNSALAAVDVDSGEARILVPAESESRPNILRLSPSGRWMSYRSVPYRPEDISAEYVTDLMVMPAAGGPSELLVKGLRSSEHNVNYSLLDYRWHPTEDRLIYLHDNALWLVDFDASGPEQARRLGSGLGELAPVVSYFTRDGRAVVAGTDPDGEGRDRVPRGLAIVPLDGTEPTGLALPDADEWQFIEMIRASEDVLWQPDSRYLGVALRDKSNGELAVMRIDVGGGEPVTLAEGLHRLSALQAGGDHDRLVGIYEDIGTPPNIYRFPADFSSKTRLSNIDPRLETVKTPTVKVLDTLAPVYDGRLERVRTTVLMPQGATKADRPPGIVMIYSGSDLSTRATYFGGGMGNTVPNLIFTSRGFAVVMADVRLAPFGEASNPLQDMVDVLLPQVYAVANAGYVDIDRLAVSGQSYGGYSTAAIVSQTNLFRAGIPVNGIFDLASFYGGMGDEDGNSHWIRWAEKSQGRMGDHPWADPLRYIVNSPFYRLDRIHTPLLIVAGEEDSTVPYTESKKLFVGLRRLERPARLLIYPGEGHVINTWSTDDAVDVSRRMVAFLRKHLMRE